MRPEFTGLPRPELVRGLLARAPSGRARQARLRLPKQRTHRHPACTAPPPARCEFLEPQLGLGRFNAFEFCVRSVFMAGACTRSGFIAACSLLVACHARCLSRAHCSLSVIFSMSATSCLSRSTVTCSFFFNCHFNCHLFFFNCQLSRSTVTCSFFFLSMSNCEIASCVKLRPV